jgi:hypothetical protein
MGDRMVHWKNEDENDNDTYEWKDFKGTDYISCLGLSMINFYIGQGD